MGGRRPRVEDDVPEPASFASGLRRAWHAAVTLSILVIIAYVALQILARTDGFREVVAQRLGDAIGMPVQIGESSVNWRFDVELREVVTEGTKRESSPGIRAKRVRIGWAPGERLRGRGGIRSIEADGLTLVFGLGEDGTWQPKPLAELSAFLSRSAELQLPGRRAVPAEPGAAANPSPNEVPSGAFPALARDARVHVAIRRGAMTWWTPESPQAPVAGIDGVFLEVTPMAAPGRQFHHVLLKVGTSAAASGALLRNLHLELVDAGDQQVVLGFAVDRVAAP